MCNGVRYEYIGGTLMRAWFDGRRYQDIAMGKGDWECTVLMGSDPMAEGWTDIRGKSVCPANGLEITGARE